MENYYHINSNINCDWKVGDEIEIGKEENYYWKSLSDQCDSIEINGESFDVYKIVNTAFGAYSRQYPPPLKMRDYHFNPVITLKETLDSLGNSLKICRELTLESIRQEYYYQLPSRQKCIWLIPENENSLTFWKNIIHNQNQKLFRVSVDGKIHRAAQKWLEGGTFSVNKWNSLAHNYWKGQDSGDIEDEILFEGTVKIIDRIV
jgi:Protein of unknown function (DUF2441)